MRKFGRNYKHDARDAGFVLHPVKSLRTQRFWNGGQVLDQGDTSSCVGHAWAAWLLAPPVSGQFLDPFGLYQLAGRYEAGDTFRPDDGATVRAGVKVLRQLGFVESYHWARDLSSLVYVLLEVSPVVVGTNWYSGMNEPAIGNVVRASGDIAGGHSYLLDAVDTKDGLLRIKNSYALEWGIGGRAWIQFEDFERLLEEEEGEACLALERRPAPPIARAA